MRTFSYPSWSKDFEDRVTATGGAGMPAIVQNFDLFNRLGLLVDHDGFLSDLTTLVDRHESAARESLSQSERLKSLRYPNLARKDWKVQLHAWMQEVYDALHELEGSPKIVVPEPPSFNRAQRRLMAKFKLGLFFVPAWVEEQFPKSWVKPNWNRYLQGADIQHLELPGKWIAFEVIPKPNYQDGKYPDDQLMEAIGLKTRFNHPHSQKGEGDDLVEDILPKVTQVLAPLGGTVQIQSAEVFSFLGNLFNWTTQCTADSFQDLGSTHAVEWCENRYGSQSALVVGGSGGGGLACVGDDWRDSRRVGVAFRFLVQF